MLNSLPAAEMKKYFFETKLKETTQNKSTAQFLNRVRVAHSFFLSYRLRQDTLESPESGQNESLRRRDPTLVGSVIESNRRYVNEEVI